MSYCRFSCDNWKSDLYVYANVSGEWTIHVAGRRRVGELPPEADWDLLKPGHSAEDMDEFMRQYRRNMDAVESAPMEAIDLPHAGETFNMAGPGEAADKIEELVALGYHCPAGVIEELREDEAESEAA